MFFLREYKPKRIKDDDVYNSRKKIFQSNNKNLDFLLRKRFLWMNDYIKNKKIIIELGSGNGCIKKILKNKKIILTDIVKYPWIKKKIDMKKMNLGKKYYNMVDIFIFNHSLHHCSNPYMTLKKISKYLKKNGLIVMNEPEASFFLRLIQYLLDDEGWSFNVNIFSKKKDIFKPLNPWLSNTATAHLLFANEKKFNRHFPNYKIEKNELSEFLIFINSSGVNQNIFHVPLNYFFNSLLNLIDKILISIFPKLFPMNRSIIIKKI
mgnify:CR=1 FL=1